MAASLAALPSIVIFSGTPCRRIALVRKRLAACSSRCSVSRKSIVCPVLSTARYRQYHSPFTLEPYDTPHAPADARVRSPDPPLRQNPPRLLPPRFLASVFCAPPS